MVAHLDREKVHAETVLAWREWLLANHQTADGVWLISWKAGTGKPRLSYEDSVIEALAVGWVDSHKRTIDDERSMLWFTRRNPTSGWAAPNTRIKRITETADNAARGERANQWQPRDQR